MSEFAAVSIKMAKEQNLSLNPTKISGVCGRLMCCLTNEEETYEELNSQLPSVGDNVTTSDGLTGTVHSLSVLRKLVKVVVNLENDEKEIREYHAEELKFRPRKRKAKVSKEEMRKLAELEKGEGASVNLENDEKEIREYHAEELKFRPRKRKAKVSKEEMRKLAELEKGEGASRLDDK